RCHQARQRRRPHGKPKRWCRKRFRSSPTGSATTFATNTCRRPITRRWRSVRARSVLPRPKPTTRLRKPARSIFVRNAPTHLRSSASASSTRPPMPPPPWVKHDPATTRLVVAGDIPLLRQQSKATIEKNYLNGRVPKALALGPFGGYAFVANQD